jgi:predicted phage tail protein
MPVEQFDAQWRLRTRASLLTAGASVSETSPSRADRRVGAVGVLVTVVGGVLIALSEVIGGRWLVAVVGAVLFVLGLVAIGVWAFRDSRRSGAPVRSSVWTSVKGAARLMWDLMP